MRQPATRNARSAPPDSGSADVSAARADHSHERHEHYADHDHLQRDSVVRRLKRAEGHLAAVRRMVEDGRDCPDILLQIAAVRAALDATAKVVLADHVESCLHDARATGNPAAWDDLRRALESFIR